MNKTVCVVSCYKPGYVRGEVLFHAASEVPGYSVIRVANKHRGLLRYPEVIWKTWQVRRHSNPDIYILAFRGYEILPFIRLLSHGRKLIFDEFINLLEWLSLEHQRVHTGSVAYRIIYTYYRYLLRKVDAIMCDTQSHAELSSEIMSLPKSKYRTVYVGADETVFTKTIDNKLKKFDKFTFIYYGSMLPLHGADIAVNAMVAAQLPKAQLVMVGGGQDIANLCNQATQKGAHVVHVPWIEYTDLPSMVRAANVCLAGPFGDTAQSQYVLTGKLFQMLQLGRATIIGKNKESYIFSDKKNTLLVKQGDSKALAQVFRWAYENQQLLGNIGKSGHELYEAKLSNEKISHQIKVVLDQLQV